MYIHTYKLEALQFDISSLVQLRLTINKHHLFLRRSIRRKQSFYTGGASSAVKGTEAEAGRRWGETRRPPAALAFDMGALTTKILNGAIPRLSAHSFIGLSSFRLLKAAGLEDVRLEVVPLLFHDRQTLEEIVHVLFYIMDNNFVYSLI